MSNFKYQEDILKKLNGIYWWRFAGVVSWVSVAILVPGFLCSLLIDSFRYSLVTSVCRVLAIIWLIFGLRKSATVEYEWFPSKKMVLLFYSSYPFFLLHFIDWAQLSCFVNWDLPTACVRTNCLFLVIYAAFAATVFSFFSYWFNIVHISFSSVHRIRVEEFKHRVVLAAFNAVKSLALLPVIVLLYYFVNEPLWTVVLDLSRGLHSDMCEEEILWNWTFCIRIIHLHISSAYIYLLAIYMNEVVQTEYFPVKDNPFLEHYIILTDTVSNRVIGLLTAALNLTDEPLFRYQAYQELERSAKFDPEIRKHIFRNASHFQQVTDVCFNNITELNTELVQYTRNFKKMPSDAGQIPFFLRKTWYEISKKIAKERVFRNIGIQLCSVRVLAQLLVVSGSSEDEQGIVLLYYYVPRVLNNYLSTVENISSFNKILTDDKISKDSYSSKLIEKMNTVFRDAIRQIISKTPIEESQIDSKYLYIYKQYL